MNNNTIRAYVQPLKPTQWKRCSYDKNHPTFKFTLAPSAIKSKFSLQSGAVPWATAAKMIYGIFAEEFPLWVVTRLR